MQIRPSQIPPEVVRVTESLEKAGFEAWIVGGCVRDLLLGRTPKDWDVTTNATPEEVQAAFPHTYYTNEFGTVGVVNDDTTDESLKVVEVTPYRLEGKYSDARRPDSVRFSRHIEDDLKRRDFTINALAYSPAKGQLLDLYGGIKDMDARLVRAVGDPKERFEEDALRIMRAVRLCAELDFALEPRTRAAMRDSAGQLSKISKERIRDEFVRIILSPNIKNTLILSHELGILQYIAPELEEGIGVAQNQAHSFDVFEHNLRTAQHAADKDWAFIVRLAGLFHDVGRVPLYLSDPARYDELVRGIPLGDPFRAREREVFGTDHHELGAELLRHWSFPTIYVDTAMEHDTANITSPHKTVIILVTVSNILVDRAVTGRTPLKRQELFFGFPRQILGRLQAR